jgi:hypothetical protein
VAEEEENPGIGCPTVSEAVLVTFGVHEPHFAQGGYIEWHQVIVVLTPVRPARRCAAPPPNRRSRE